MKTYLQSLIVIINIVFLVSKHANVCRYPCMYMYNQILMHNYCAYYVTHVLMCISHIHASMHVYTHPHAHRHTNSVNMTYTLSYRVH